MKILFVQLPLIDYSHTYLQGNIEYAPAVMAAFLSRRTRLPVEFEFLPFHLANFASNDVISRYITSLAPAAVSFTTYVWNLERNLRIAAGIKKILPEMRIVFGGPEINPGSYAFTEKRPQVDYFVNGEGEWFFKKYLEGGDIHRHSSKISGNLLITQPRNELLPVDDITEPYTNNYLTTLADCSIFLELTRGCPYLCGYCFYSKNYTTVRELPVEILLQALDRPNRSLSEIYILSPTFNKSRSFRKNLELIASRNRGTRLHTEMRADGIDASLAAAIYKAGFRSLETGLQTLTPAALKKMGRNSDVRKELRGMRHLKDAGIDLKIGIIPGLPGDTPDRFITTIKTLIDWGFDDNIELYPLMLLPGTRVRDLADRDSALYQDKPPYYLLQGWEFPAGSISSIVEGTARLTGMLPNLAMLPDFTSSGTGLLNRGVKFDGRIGSYWELPVHWFVIETAVFSFHILLQDAQPDFRLLKKLIRALPQDDQLYDIILYTDCLLDQDAIRKVQNILPEDTLFQRINLYSAETEYTPVRCFQVMERIKEYFTAVESYNSVTPILRVDTENFHHLQEHGIIPARILVGESVYSRLKRYLVDNFGDSVESVAFECERDMADFYEETGVGLFSMPEFSVTGLR